MPQETGEHAQVMGVNIKLITTGTEETLKSYNVNLILLEKGESSSNIASKIVSCTLSLSITLLEQVRGKLNHFVYLLIKRRKKIFFDE